MDEIKKRLITEILALHKEAVEIYNTEVENHEIKTVKKSVKKTGPINQAYQSWYSKSLPVIRQLLPERYQEFQDQYKLERHSNKTTDFLTYTIYDYLIGLRVTRGGQNVFDPFAAFASKFHLQITILASAIDRIDSSLADIEGLLQSELFQNELLAANELFKKKHLRAAGTLAGVSLEMHLGRICMNHNFTINKKSPAISDFNEALKLAKVIDVPTWRHIQLLGDIRNLCVHAKEREPTSSEISDLISGTKKILATIF